MPTSKDLYKEALMGSPQKVVTEPHVRWLQTPEEEQVYTDKAIEFVSNALRRKFKHSRPGRFSPSAMGACHRRVVFGYAGAPAEQPEIDNQEQMDHGSWTGLKWQAEGLTVGWIKEAEVWVYNDDLLSGGSMDALLSDDSLFELKSAGWRIYQDIVSVNLWPKWETLMQVHNYFILADKDMASIVIENRSSGQFHEFRIPRDSQIEKEVLHRLMVYKAYAEEDELPPMLEMCGRKKGDIYRRCPYRNICSVATNISSFGHVT